LEEFTLQGTKSHIILINFEGPLNVQFPIKRDDLSLRVPNLVEIYDIKRIRINPNVQLKANGITSISLSEPIELLVHPQNQNLNVTFKSTPRIEVTGKSLRFSSENKVKYRWFVSHVIRPKFTKLVTTLW
jgi:hypothetical protein